MKNILLLLVLSLSCQATEIFSGTVNGVFNSSPVAVNYNVGVSDASWQEYQRGLSLPLRQNSVYSIYLPMDGIISMSSTDTLFDRSSPFSVTGSMASFMNGFAETLAVNWIDNLTADTFQYASTSVNAPYSDVPEAATWAVVLGGLALLALKRKVH